MQHFPDGYRQSIFVSGEIRRVFCSRLGPPPCRISESLELGATKRENLLDATETMLQSPPHSWKTPQRRPMGTRGLLHFPNRSKSENDRFGASIWERQKGFFAYIEV